MHKTPRMLEVEAEFHGDIRDIIQDFRAINGGNSWRTVAGILGVSQLTLRKWRVSLGLGLDESDRVYDPSSFDGGHRPSHLDHRARALGYEDAEDAILDCRIKRKLTREDAAALLGCHPNTIRNHTPDRWRGKIVNRSERWYARDFATNHSANARNHPWHWQTDRWRARMERRKGR